MIALLIQVGILAYLTAVEPFIGKRLYERLQQTVGTDPMARIRDYRRTMVMEWGLAGLLAVSMLADGAPLSNLGLRIAPVPAYVLGPLIGAGLGLILPVILVRVSPAARERFSRQLANVQAFLPATAVERRYFAAVSLTAGICEEILFRGLPFMLIPNPWAALAFSTAAFGFAHFYQGWKGVLLTAVLGLLFGALYLMTGSLLFPILLHIAIDLRNLAFTPGKVAA